jgi:hypothetical protein
MKISKSNPWIFCVAASVTIAVAFPARLACQTVVVKSPAESLGSGSQWSVQVERIDPGDLDVAHSFQIAIYENLAEELKKTKRFKYVLREGDSNAGSTSDLLILKTTVVKYTAGSETQRAVTTVSGATKLTVQSQQYQVLGALHDVLKHDIEGAGQQARQSLKATSADTVLVVPLPDSSPASR